MIIELGKGKVIYLFHKVKQIDVALAIKHLATMIKSGLAMDDALGVMQKQVEDKLLQETFAKIHQDVLAGNTLGESMKKHPKVFSPIIISVVEIGEEGSTLEKNLEFLSLYLKRQYELNRKIKGSTTYPLIIFALTLIEMVGVIYLILPKLESVFKGFAEIPAFTKLILDGSNFVRDNGVALIVGLVVIFLIIRRFFGTKMGTRIKNRLALTIPVFKNLNQKIFISTFARTLGILLGSGVPLQKALSITQSTIGNIVFEQALTKVSEKVKNGVTLAGSLEEFPKLFPPSFVKMIETGESTGTLEENLQYLYDFYTEEVIDISNNLTTLLEPILLIFVGVMIGGLALLIITPIYQLTGSINA